MLIGASQLPSQCLAPRRDRSESSVVNQVSDHFTGPSYLPLSTLELAANVPSRASTSLPLLRQQSEVAARALQAPGESTESSPWLEATGTGAGITADAAGATSRLGNTLNGATQATTGTGKTARVLGQLAPTARIAGPVGGVLAAGAQVTETGLQIRDITNNAGLNESQKESLAGQAAVAGAGKMMGGLGGMAAGMAAGSALGAVAGPPGIAVGLVVGAVAGGLGGDWLGGKLGERLGDSGLGRTVGKLFA